MLKRYKNYSKKIKTDRWGLAAFCRNARKSLAGIRICTDMHEAPMRSVRGRREGTEAIVIVRAAVYDMGTCSGRETEDFVRTLRVPREKRRIISLFLLLLWMLWRHWHYAFVILDAGGKTLEVVRKFMGQTIVAETVGRAADVQNVVTPSDR